MLALETDNLGDGTLVWQGFLFAYMGCGDEGGLREWGYGGVVFKWVQQGPIPEGTEFTGVVEGNLQHASL